VPGAGPTVTLDIGIGTETEAGLAILEALLGVTEVLEIDGPALTFQGRELAGLGPLGRFRAVRLFACPRGHFLYFAECSPDAPPWAAGGGSMSEALAAIHEAEVRRQVAEALRGQGIPA